MTSPRGGEGPSCQRATPALPSLERCEGVGERGRDPGGRGARVRGWPRVGERGVGTIGTGTGGLPAGRQERPPPARGDYSRPRPRAPPPPRRVVPACCDAGGGRGGGGPGGPSGAEDPAGRVAPACCDPPPPPPPPPPGGGRVPRAYRQFLLASPSRPLRVLLNFVDRVRPFGLKHVDPASQGFWSVRPGSDGDATLSVSLTPHRAPSPSPPAAGPGRQ